MNTRNNNIEISNCTQNHNNYNKNDKTTDNVNKLSTNKNTPQTNKSKMPPINLYNAEVLFLKKSIKNDLKIDNFLVKELNNNHAVIYTKNLDDYKNICDMLSKAETNYYTYTPKEIKKVTLVLKGISNNYSCDEILNCLKAKEKKSITFEKVTQLATKRSIEQNINLPYYIVQASPNSSVNDIKNIKEIDHSIVTWENIKRKPIQQCTRCQRFSHTAANCHMDYRCVKCGENHKIGECKIRSEDGRDKLYCTLCKQHGHPASYKNCPEYKRRMQIKEELKIKLKQNITQRHMSYNNYIQTDEFLTAFSLKKNILWLLDTTPSSDDISTVHGIRFVNAIMLLVSHKSMAALFNPFMNRTYLAENLGKTWTVIGRAASLYTDPFLLISGMLTAYSMLGSLERGGKINVKKEWMSRIFRILPPVVALMLFCTFIMPHIGSGPQWNLVVGTHANLCKAYWWRLLLFIQNYFGFREMCLTHTHHLGIDTQLFFFSPFIILSLYNWPRNTCLLLIFAIGLGTAMRFYTSCANELANYIYFGASIKQLFKTADLVYTFPPYRSSVYIMGVMLGYLLRKLKCIPFSQTQLRIGWILAFLCFSLTLILPSSMSEKVYSYNAFHAAMYSAFAPLSWCSFFSWIIFVSHMGYKNFVTKFLSWKGFLISTKLSYSLYLTQFPVFFYNVGRRRNGDFYYNFTTIMI
ncbi:nose resistant to fluoxetine protein 6-like isoform X2 [Condylostylus longicornis]|nr:nose resistant to fluoxetine protein 6-like isoform X2 [Condylostylus longicornis]